MPRVCWACTGTPRLLHSGAKCASIGCPGPFLDLGSLFRPDQAAEIRFTRWFRPGDKRGAVGVPSRAGGTTLLADLIPVSRRVSVLSFCCRLISLECVLVAR